MEIGEFERERLTNCRYADDILLFVKSLSELREKLIMLREELASAGVEIYENKIKILPTVNDHGIDCIAIGSMTIEMIGLDESHPYLRRQLSTSTNRAKKKSQTCLE